MLAAQAADDSGRQALHGRLGRQALPVAMTVISRLPMAEMLLEPVDLDFPGLSSLESGLKSPIKGASSYEDSSPS
jgi:hypothetical protein